MFRRSTAFYILITAALLLPLTGFAAPRALDTTRTMAGIERFDGSPTAPPTTTGLWRQLVFELRRDKATNAEWSTARELQRRALDATAPDFVPIGLLDTSVQDLRSGALGRIFAAAALRPAVYHGRQIVFAFDPDWLLGDAPERVELDPGDGGGWRPLDADGRLTAYYESTGEATVRLRAFTDGDLRHASFPLRIAALTAPAPHDTLHVNASVPWDGATASGDAYVYLAPGRTVLQNPVVMVEGFDLDDTMDWDVIYELLNQQQMIETLRAEGFDAVVLDFDVATEPIQRNAFVLTELLALVNAEIGPARTTTLVGASMGGLVTRYALGWLEQQGIDHQVRTWISFDAPHLGAVIPLGLQHWLEFFQSDSESAAFLLNRLDTPAARQLLLQHHAATTGTVAAADPLRASFMSDLLALALPTCRRVAIANGSGSTLDQGFAPGQQIIRYEYYSLPLDLKGNVWALPDGNQIRIFQGEQNIIWPFPDTYVDIHIGGTQPWDNAPGGWRASMAQMDTTSVPYGDIEALAHHHAFIPTISALDLDVGDPFYDVAGDTDLMSHTTFDALYVPALNQEHITITAESAVWFMEEIRAGVVAVDETPTIAVALQTWPNPFNAATTIAFAVAEDEPVKLEIFDLRGRRVVTLLDERLAPGRHEVVWRGRNGAGTPASTGNYLVRLTTRTAASSSRITLLE